MEQIITLKPGAPAVTVDQNLRIALEHLIIEAIAADPSGAYPAGSGVNANLKCADGYGHQQDILLNELSAPYHGKRIDFFQGYHLRWVKYHHAGGGSLELGVKKLARGDYQELGTFTLKRKAPLQIDDRLEVTFNAHSHKRSRTGGPASPLMLNLDYQQLGRETERGVGDKLKPAEGRRDWYWHEYRFHLVDHSYNDWMKVEIWRAKAKEKKGPPS